ncbi:MAG: catalase [Oscillospiraceae bacterium]|nr:catalase [Oscillospiraceae bacterium]
MLHLIKHFRTITQHRHMVFKLCIKAGIPIRGLLHDMSKYSPTEFLEGARFYLGFKSPTEREREVYGYSKAWMHHKGRNRHHFEYWTDYNMNTKRLEPVKMPIKFVKEMFCDRVAAGRVYLGKDYTNDNPINYFLKGRAKSAMHPETAKLLESWLLLLQKEGEEAVFKKIRATKDY